MLLAEPRKKSLVAVDGQTIRRLRERSLVMTQREFAEAIGLSEPGLRKIESKVTHVVTPKTFRALAKVFGFDLEQAKTTLSPRVDWDANIDPYSRVNLLPIPEFELSIAAGGWSDTSELGELDYDSQQSIVNQRLFRVRIRGDSMMPEYRDGDLIEFEMIPRSRLHELMLGRDYAVFCCDDVGTFKRLEAVDEDQLILRPLNRKKYKEPIEIARSLVTAIALAVGRYERLG